MKTLFFSLLLAALFIGCSKSSNPAANNTPATNPYATDTIIQDSVPWRIMSLRCVRSWEWTNKSYQIGFLAVDSSSDPLHSFGSRLEFWLPPAADTGTYVFAKSTNTMRYDSLEIFNNVYTDLVDSAAGVITITSAPPFADVHGCLNVWMYGIKYVNGSRNDPDSVAYIDSNHFIASW